MVQLHLSFPSQWCDCTFLYSLNCAVVPLFPFSMVWLHLSLLSQWCGCTCLSLLNGAAASFSTISMVRLQILHPSTERKPNFPDHPAVFLMIWISSCNDRVFHATLAILVWKVLFYVMVEKSKRKVFGEHVSISDWWISFYCVGQLNELKFYAMSALG